SSRTMPGGALGAPHCGAPRLLDAFDQIEFGELADLPVRVRLRIRGDLHSSDVRHSGRVGGSQHLPELFAPRHDVEAVHRARHFAVTERVERATILAPGEGEL